MGKLLGIALDLVPGGSFVKGIVGGLAHAFGGGSFNEGYEKASAQTQVVINRDTGEIIFLIWFLTLLTGYFIPPIQPYIIDGFSQMQATLPEPWQEDLHLIVMALFAINLGHKYINRK